MVQRLYSAGDDVVFMLRSISTFLHLNIITMPSFPDDEESRECFLAGLIIRSLSINTSNWRCTEELSKYLAERNIMGIYDVDTRAITRKLRQDGRLIGVLSTEGTKTDEELLEMSRSWDIVGVDLISGVSCKEPYEWVDKTKSDWEFNTNGGHEKNHRVIAYDFGIKHNILRRLASYGNTGKGSRSVMAQETHLLSHQLLGQALGGKTFNMKFGHPGGNHPVRNIRNGRVEISAQNHNYVVDPATLPKGVEVTHVNLNDGTCAGLTYPALNVMSLQYHPEASPGPHDSDCVFRDFVELMKSVEQQHA
ncbi:hypothetical protein Q3G72_030159 [Acer saccharum]|nr:hypothetical protein Q3G72_030159 [Acer saccharum]